MKALGKLKAEPGVWMYDAKAPNAPLSGEVLIRIKKTSICGTDIHIYKWDDWAQKTVPVPMTIGHEFVGIVEEVGPDVKYVKIGDRVSGEGHLTCGYCRSCRAGNRHLCRETFGIGYDCPGTFTEFFVMPVTNIFKVPDEISDDVAAIFDPLGNAIHTALSFDLIGEDVLITGAGPIGIMGAAIAKQVGARNVVITDVNPYRLELAKKVGVTRAVNVETEDLKQIMTELGMTEGFDVGLEMSGSGLAFKQMIDTMNHGGKIALLGILPDSVEVCWSDVIFKSILIKGIYGREIFETWYKMSSLLQSGLDISPVLTHTFPVDQYEDAFKVMLEGKSGKVILDWS